MEQSFYQDPRQLEFDLVVEIKVSYEEIVRHRGNYDYLPHGYGRGMRKFLGRYESPMSMHTILRYTV